MPVCSLVIQCVSFRVNIFWCFLHSIHLTNEKYTSHLLDACCAENIRRYLLCCDLLSTSSLIYHCNNSLSLLLYSFHSIQGWIQIFYSSYHAVFKHLHFAFFSWCKTQVTYATKKIKFMKVLICYLCMAGWSNYYAELKKKRV